MTNKRKNVAISLDLLPRETYVKFENDFFADYEKQDQKNFFRNYRESSEKYKLRLEQLPLIVSGFNKINWLLSRFDCMLQDDSLKVFLNTQPLLKNYLKENLGFESILCDLMIKYSGHFPSLEKEINNLLEISPEINMNSHYIWSECHVLSEPYDSKNFIASPPPLHLAFYLTDKETVALLMQNGAAINNINDIKLGSISTLKLLEEFYEATPFDYLKLLDEKYNQKRNYTPLFDIITDLADRYISDDLLTLGKKIDFINKKEHLDPTIDWDKNTVLDLDFLENIDIQKETSFDKKRYLKQVLEKNHDLLDAYVFESPYTLEHYIQKINSEDLKKTYHEILISRTLHKKTNTSKHRGRL